MTRLFQSGIIISELKILLKIKSKKLPVFCVPLMYFGFLYFLLYL
nr:MAG TPA: hypothetical protein [Bacteriophage sp.]